MPICTGWITQGENVSRLRGVGAGVRSSPAATETAVRTSGAGQPARQEGRRAQSQRCIRCQSRCYVL